MIFRLNLSVISFLLALTLLPQMVRAESVPWSSELYRADAEAAIVHELPDISVDIGPPFPVEAYVLQGNKADPFYAEAYSYIDASTMFTSFNAAFTHTNYPYLYAKASFAGSYIANHPDFMYSFEYTAQITNSRSWITVEDLAESQTLFSESFSDDSSGIFYISTPIGHEISVSFGIESLGSLTYNMAVRPVVPEPVSSTLWVNETGLSSDSNNPPSIPILDTPVDGEGNLGTTVEFRWEKCSDPDGDDVTYDILVCEDNAFTTGCINEENIAAVKAGTVFFAGSGIGMLFFGIALAGDFKKKRRKIAVLIITVIMISILATACGSGGGNDELMSGTVSGLENGKTYFWKVVVDDGNGGLTESEIRSFTTQ